MGRLLRTPGQARFRAFRPGPAATLAGRARRVLSLATDAITLPLHRRSRHAWQPPVPASECLERVAELAAALDACGAISAAAAAEVVDGLRSALAARSLIDPQEFLGDVFARTFPPSPAAPGGPVRAIPVGAQAESELLGPPFRLYLGALIVDQRSALLTMQSRFDADLSAGGPEQAHQLFQALSDCTAVDDRGATYQAHFSGGGGSGRWDGRFQFQPLPPASARWLDVTPPGALAAIRVRLDTAPVRLPVTSAQLPASERADRYLDGLVVGRLADGWDRRPNDRTEPPVVRIAAGLVAAGVLTPGSPSVRRLAAVEARRGQRLPAALAGVEPASLPGDWLRLLARYDSTDGPAGVIAVAATLPDVDGVSCVITELASWPDVTTLQAHAHGWPEPRHGPLRRDEPFSLSARDDRGGWYVSSEGGWSYSDGETDLEVRLHPPLDPAARTLRIILTGPESEASVTVPLDWHASTTLPPEWRERQ